MSITQFTEALPSADDPATFDARANALMLWLTASFAPEVKLAAEDIAAALAGAGDLPAAVAQLQGVVAGLGDMATLNAVDFYKSDATWAAGVNTGQATISPAQLRAALNASGDPPIYACRAWVSFTGTDTVTIRASGNVSSVTDNGTGDYTVNFAEDMPDADYTVVATPTRARTDKPNWVYHIQPNDPAHITASSVRLRGGYVSGTNDGGYNAAVDFPQVSVAIFR